MSRLLAGAALAGAVLTAPFAHAQTNAIPTAVEELLVRVDISKISDQLAVHMGLGSDALPRSVEVPLQTAAEVCEVTTEQLMLVRAVEQHVECQAATVTEDLAAATEEHMAEAAGSDPARE